MWPERGGGPEQREPGRGLERQSGGSTWDRGRGRPSPMPRERQARGAACGQQEPGWGREHVCLWGVTGPGCHGDNPPWTPSLCNPWEQTRWGPAAGGRGRRGQGQRVLGPAWFPSSVAPKPSTPAGARGRDSGEEAGRHGPDPAAGAQVRWRRQGWGRGGGPWGREEPKESWGPVHRGEKIRVPCTVLTEDM